MAFYQNTHKLSPEYFIVERKCDFVFPLHLHRHFEAIIINEGDMLVQVNCEEYILHQGDCIFIMANEPHSLKTIGHSKHTLFIFSPEIVQQFTNITVNLLPEYPVFNAEKYLIPSIAKDINNDTNIIKVKGFLYYLCGCFKENTNLVPSSDYNYPQTRLLQQILKYVDVHFRENCTLSQMSGDLGYDYSYLSKLFMKYIGMNFTSYLSHVRINYACDMLTTTDERIIDISLLSGYKSLRSFNRNFIDVLGTTPSEYRKTFQR